MKERSSIGSTFSQSKICAISDNRTANKLASEATASCSKCGAMAHDPASLCSPVPLSGKS